ncbi:class I SAM-dependent methyltransferase [Coralloluteibacterium stylophorae]|uniref:Class I SAM-dependent methyltransferase n=1 Tax=Coralloluteibacterium stylophorae TaxID=1776034 RepID=A0A8J7VRR2_9GAMM|nr:class I SAM-dependent methyltransferase [Coralloluteibacterium stylophorae]MBS7456002.1 class I SAM-dependent methyltransferase [Coralloluteibacterium stylophorae]
MQPDELVSLFDQQAAGYDRQWAKTAAIRECLYFLLEPLLAGLPAEARVLCVGAGTGAEMARLAQAFPGWRFTAVEPSGAMLEACRARAEAEGIAGRCDFHRGFLDSLPAGAPYDAATCFLVSQFIVDRAARTAFFAGIAARLRPGGLLASSDLAADTAAPAYDILLPAWMRMMAAADVPLEALARIREAYARDVAVLPPAEVAALIAAGGFGDPVQFFQAGLIHGWLSRRLG